MPGTIRAGERFRLTIVAAERHPLGRDDAREAFRRFQEEYRAELAEQGVVILFRGVPIDSPSVIEDTQLVPLADGSIGWRNRVTYSVESIDPDSPLLEHGPVPGSALTAVGPVVLVLAALALVAATVFGTIVATNALEEVSTTAERVGDAVAETAERVAPQLEAALVLGFAVVVLLLLR